MASSVTAFMFALGVARAEECRGDEIASTGIFVDGVCFEPSVEEFCASVWDGRCTWQDVVDFVGNAVPNEALRLYTCAPGSRAAHRFHYQCCEVTNFTMDFAADGTLISVLWAGESWCCEGQHGHLVQGIPASTCLAEQVDACGNRSYVEVGSMGFVFGGLGLLRRRRRRARPAA